jgi:N12 class adenine-specific DNA methylase
VLKALEEEERAATEDEKRALVRYVGWGAFAQALFDRNPQSANARNWAQERAELGDLLTSPEWDSARASTLNAHYTSEPVIKGVWQALRHLGFKGGRVLEPAAGIGHFIGLTPDELRNEVAWSGAELDTITGRIAKALYPGADIRIEGFETSRWPDGYFDLAISNVPFGDHAPRDPRYKPMSIHDFFFVKALDKVRPGGIVAFITSHYTLDKEADFARREIAKRAEFLGAIRLPGGNNGAFKANAGTEVTADIVFLRRRDGGDLGDQGWLDLATVETPDGPAVINRYFAENPRMMLGEIRLRRTVHASPSLVLTGSPDALDAQIAKAAMTLPKGAFLERSERSVRREPNAEPDLDAIPHKEGAFYLRGGQIHQRVLGVGEVQDFSSADRAKLIALIGIRDIVNDLLKPNSGADEDRRNELRRDLNRAYDAFVARYGPINKTILTVTSRLRQDGSPVILRRMPNFAVFREDPDAFKVAALENYSERDDSAVKTAIFTHDVVRQAEEPVITGPADALAVSLNRTGRVDMPLIAEALGIDEDQAIQALGDAVWLDPAGDVWRTVAEYLSGDVVLKLEDARIAARDDGRYARNVAVLEAVQPAPLTRVDIRILFGAPWVPADIYKAFLAEALSIKADGLVLGAVSKKWQFTEKPEIPASAEAQYATSRSSTKDVIEAAINNAEIRIFDANPDPNGSPTYNAAASEESNVKLAALREAFSGGPETGVEGWIWQDENRARSLEDLYNTKFNRLVPTVYDGAHQTMPGLARYISTGSDRSLKRFKLNAHQLNAIWRIVSSGNTLIDHAVGAGKTFTMIGAGQEQKRLGLIRRPMYVVPNHMLEQFTREFLQAYPAAQVLVADKESMTKDKRRAFAARTASGNWDAVIITHDAFGRIRMSDETYRRFVRNEIQDLEFFIGKAAQDEGRSSPTVKDLERAKKRLEARLERQINEESKDEGITFEELGVDFLFVDEAHAFKNLSFRTRHTRVKGISAVESQRATDLYLKISYLEEKCPARSAVFATGTPVSNTIAEMYTMQRYLQRQLLVDYGIDEFDAWAATFGDIVTQVELAPSGKGFRTARSFSKFVNIPELIALYSRVADTQTSEMLQLERPRLKNGRVTVVETEMSERELAYMESLVQRAEAIKGKRPETGRDNMLKILGEGLRLATDIRLLEPDAAINPDGKTLAAVERITRIWEAGKEPALCQIVFLDMGVPGSKSRQRRDESAEDGETDESEPQIESGGAAQGFNLYEDIRARLVARGIPREQIAFIHEADNDVKKGQLFSDVREGTVRVLLGSTGKMGVGTNVQRQLAAMHHLDAPWRPADVEQRDGRILRQGNLNEEVEIFRYVTRRSLDAYRWQILTTKANFIAQLRAGARGIRTAEDIDSPLPEASMIKAAATGDPRITEHAELSKELREIEAAKRAHERSALAARAAFHKTRQRIAELTDEIALTGKDSAAAIAKGAGPFRFQLSSAMASITERKAAGEALRSEMLKKADWLFDTTPVRVEAGELNGFKIIASVRKGVNGFSYGLAVAGERQYSRDDDYPLSESIDPIGLMRRCEGLIKAIPKLLEARECDIAKAQADLPRLERQLTPPSFAKSDRLQTIKLRLCGIEKALQPDHDKPETVAAVVTVGHDGEKLLAPAASTHASISSAPRDRRLEDKIARLKFEHEDGNKRATGRGR